MPFINTKVNIKLSNEQKEILNQKLCKAIEIFPGKTKQWLMLEFEDEKCLYFRGENNSKLAYLEVKILGKSDKSSYNKMTNELCNIINEVLGIEKDNIYIKYEEIDYWGWNGNNF